MRDAKGIAVLPLRMETQGEGASVRVLGDMGAGMGGTRGRMKFPLLSLRFSFVSSGSGHLGSIGIYDIKPGSCLRKVGLCHLVWSLCTREAGNVY